MKAWALALMPLTMAACNATTPAAPADTDEAEVHRLLTLCKLPRSTIRLIGNDEARLQPPADASYDSVDCLLRELKTSRLKSRHLGFVGNEAYAPEEPKKN